MATFLAAIKITTFLDISTNVLLRLVKANSL